MKITKENIDELNAIITVSIEKNDYATTVEDVLKDYRKKANIPGFRPGKVPAGLVKKMYGKAVLAEEVNKLLSKNLTQYITDEKLNLLGEPLPNEEKQPEIDWDKNEDFDFIFDVGLAPEVDVKLDKRSKYPFYKIVADKKLIDKQLEAYTSQFGTNNVVEEIAEKDTVRGNFIQLDADGNELEDGIKAERVVIAIDVMKNENVKKEFIGKKEGDVVIFDPIKTYENRHEVGHMLNVSHEEAEKIEGNFKFTIVEVLRFEKAALNEDLYKKIYGEECEIKTQKEFKEKVKEDLENNFIHSSNYKFALDTRDLLLQKTPFELPEDFLKRWVKATNKELTEEQIEKDFDNFMVDLKWQLIKDKVVKDNELKINEEDVVALAKNMALMQFRQYGINNVPDEHLENYAAEMLKNEEERRKIIERKLEDMVITSIKEKVSIEDKEVTLDEFNKMLENK